MKKRQLLSILLLAPLVLICGQSRVIEFSLEGFHPTHQVTGKKGVLIKVESTHVPNLLKQYDANPFNKPVITSADGMQQNLYSVFTDYVSGIGMDPRSESENQIQLKTILCSINYLSGRGWTATAKFEIEISRNNMVLLHQSIGAYEVEGGNDKDIYLGEKVINRALFNAFESFNWESVADKLSDDRTNSADAQSPADQYTPVFSTHPQNDHATLQNTGRYYALLIAIEDYKYINKLDKPIGDATQLYNILSSSYGFHREDIFFLKNPDRAQIIDKLDFLVSTIKEDDNLLIFYAGHGYWDEERQTGYWLPADAKKSSTANWLRNSTIQEYIGDIRSKHTLLIADACFGGGIFKTRKAFDDAPNAINQVYELNSRKAITSGMLNEVPDKSVFFQYLLRRLELNTLKYISSLQLFSSFRTAVMNNSDNVPQYGTIQKAGDEGGDFVFIRVD